MRAQEINRELTLAQDVGPVKDIVIPPCPQLLIQLQHAIDQPDPDPEVVASIAGSDVAMAAALIKLSNSSLFALREPVKSVNQAVSMLGVRPTATVLTCFLLRNTIRIDPTVIEHFWESSTRRSLAIGWYRAMRSMHFSSISSSSLSTLMSLSITLSAICRSRFFSASTDLNIASSA